MARRHVFSVIALPTLLVFACAKQGGGGMGGGGGATPSTDEEKTLYALGMSMGQSLTPFQLTPAELNLVKSGLTDQVLGNKAQVDMATFGPRIGEFARGRQQANAEVLAKKAAKEAEGEKTKGKEYADAAAKEPGAEALSSGLIYRELTAGSGASPKPSDTVKVHYKGTLIDGKEFDSSYKRNEPATFPLHGVIPCWTEGVQKMKVGGKAKLVCPSNIAYGDNGRPPQIPGGATLVFEVELVEITTPPQPPPGMPPPGTPPPPPPPPPPAQRK